MIHNCGPAGQTSTFSAAHTRYVLDDAWVYNIEPAPTDNCGMAYVARFEKDLASKDVTFWRHKTRRTVTNRSGSEDGLACSEINETEYTYDWEPKTAFKGCDYVTLN
jgi:hypothetical protein